MSPTAHGAGLESWLGGGEVRSSRSSSAALRVRSPPGPLGQSQKGGREALFLFSCPIGRPSGPRTELKWALTLEDTHGPIDKVSSFQGCLPLLFPPGVVRGAGRRCCPGHQRW